MQVGFVVFAVFSSARAMDTTSGACEGDTCAATHPDDEISMMQLSLRVNKTSQRDMAAGIELATCQAKCRENGYCCGRISGCAFPSCYIGCETAKGTNSLSECKAQCAAYSGCTATIPGGTSASMCHSCAADSSGGGVCTAQTGGHNKNCEPSGGCDYACSLEFPTTTTTTLPPTTLPPVTTIAPVSATSSECLAKPNWHAGYGACDTYAPGLITNGAENYAYCDMDKSRTGVMASETCEECGTCFRLPACASVANWHAGYGSCDTYESGLITDGAENFAYCDLDKSRKGVMASEACEECGKCSISNPSTLGDDEPPPKATRLVQEEAEKVMAEKRTRNPRRT